MKSRVRPLAARLTRTNLLVSSVVLLLAAGAFLSYDLFLFRRDLIRNIDAEAQIVGENAITALVFNDPQSAASTLRGLQHAPEVVGATIVTDSNEVFANYGLQTHELDEPPLFNAFETKHVWSSGTHVLLAHRIMFEGKSVGVVYISATLTEMPRRARQFFIIACLILTFCMAAALITSSFARRLIAQPIQELADTALRVSQHQDYSARAKVTADSAEIVILIDAFNTMLGRIQERDAALNEARDELENRVEERTAQLQAANRELEAFSYSVAHDLRNPLQGINSISFLLEQLCAEYQNPNIAMVLDNLNTTTGHMSAVIDSLLTFAQASRAALQRSPVSLSAIAREIASGLKTAEPDREVEFVIHDLPEVSADPGLIRIALENLLRNSWKYTSGHKLARIEVGAQTVEGNRNSSQPIFFIRDDGAGFDPSRISELFQPFHRLHGKNEFSGTGIGLATVQRILSRHGGSIWAEGAVEKGAAFYFKLD